MKPAATKDLPKTAQRTKWIGRALLLFLATVLIWSWANSEFGMMRGGGVACLHAHLFFLGLSALCVLGWACSCSTGNGRQLIQGFSILVAFATVWISVSLIVLPVAPVWLWLVLSVLWLALPIAVAIVLMGRKQRLDPRRVWAVAGTTLPLAAVALLLAWRPLAVSIHRLEIDAGERWIVNRQGLGRFRFDFMLWSIAGGPPHDLDLAGHRQNLVKLGYFQETEFPLERASLHEVLQLAQKVRFADSLWSVSPSTNGRSFNLTAYGGDLSRWRDIVKQAEEDHR